MKTVFSSVPFATSNANYVYLTVSARIAEFAGTVRQVSGATIATTVASAMTFVSDAVSVQVVQLFAKNVTPIVTIVQIFVNTVGFANIAVKKIRNATTECALKIPSMSTISVLTVDNASVQTITVIAVTILKKTVAHPVVIWL